MNKRLIVVALLFIALVLLRMSIYRSEGFQGQEGQEEKKLIIAKADWCGHCRKAAPEFEKLRQASPIRLADGNQAIVEILDADQNKSEISALGVKGFPTIMVMNGTGKTEYPGERTYDAIVEFLNKGK
jgi:thiol-disulfide isomerase/thioredoxin